MGVVNWVLDHLELVAIIAVFLIPVVALRRQKASAGKAAARDEALFASMFPDLQPHFHPRKLVEYVRARRATSPPRSGKVWRSPPGFAVHDADIRFEGGREQVRLRDAAGMALASFVFEEHAEGGVLRFGKGKFTVSALTTPVRVRYWHPDREFKWSATKGWTFTTRMADEPFSGSSDSSSSSSSSSWSDSRTTAAAAGAAGVAIAGAGGAFDGGGASQAWDEGGSGTGSAGDSGGGSTASATSY